MTSHRLDALLKPRSIALVGASIREASPGRNLSEMVINSDYSGNVYPVNPGYDEILGHPCYADLTQLPGTADHVVLAVSNGRLEQALGEAIAHGARAATIYETCFLEDDLEPPLKQRLADMANAASMAICGGNGMGFYSVAHNLHVGIYPVPGAVASGNITYIAQSGSAFTAFAHNVCRLKFNLCVSSGNEFVTTVADYMDWSLEQPETRVIGLFLETVRDPGGFIAALEKARQNDIPVVVLKVGRSALGAKLAHTHTGAIAGDDAAYEALFRKYGVIVVSDFGEMAATLMMFQYPRRAGPGSLATIQESGGFRELVTDLADDLGIDFADISDVTKEGIQQHLEPGLVAENPLDAWGTNADFENRFYHCLSQLAKDPSVAATAFFASFRDNYYLSEAFFRIVEKVSVESEKPIAMVNCFGDLTNQQLRVSTSANGIPLIDGTREALLAIRHLFQFRDSRYRDHKPGYETIQQDENITRKWIEILTDHHQDSLDEHDAMELLSDFSIPVPAHARADDLQSLLQAAKETGFPVVLKTAQPGIQHKTEQNGVKINLRDEVELAACYRDFEERLGPSVLVSAMVSNGTEIGLGLVNDPQFGPFVMISAGGTLIELISDRALGLAPVSKQEALEMIASLRVNALLTGIRGKPPGNIAALADIVVALSNIGTSLTEVVAEIDINPVIVSPSGAVAVDALIVKKSPPAL